MRSFVYVICVALTLLAPASFASSVTLNPGDRFQIDFSVNPSSCVLTCDTLLFSADATGGPFLEAEGIGSLYNGSTLLGTVESINCCTTVFESSSSAWGLVGWYATVVDFTSIQDGTIQGIFDYSVTGGSITFDPSQSIFSLSQAFGPGGLDAPEGPVIESETIIRATPEPTRIPLVFGALIFLGIAVKASRARSQNTL